MDDVQKSELLDQKMAAFVGLHPSPTDSGYLLGLARHAYTFKEASAAAICHEVMNRTKYM